MDYYQKLKELIHEMGGIITSKEITEKGIPRTYITELVKNQELQRSERGVYVQKGIEEDRLYCFQKRYAYSVFSHESSLFIKGIISEQPSKHAVTVKSGSNTKNLLLTGSKVFSVKNELFYLGLVQESTSLGRKVNTYDFERCICDLIRSRNRLDSELITKTIKEYLATDKYDKEKLLQYAEKFKIKRLVNNFFEFFHV